MRNFVGKLPSWNPLSVAIETMLLHIAQTCYFKDCIVSHLGGPNKQFGIHDKLSWAVQVHGKLN